MLGRTPHLDLSAVSGAVPGEHEHVQSTEASKPEDQDP